jgi:predicted transposase YdaD
VLKGGAEESTVQRALRILRADEQLSQLETVMAFFASFVLDSSLVRQIMRWDMAVLSESPWYQQILNEGRQEGLQAGRQEGKQEEAVAMITRKLNRRFGSLSPELQERLRGLTLEQLEELSEVLLDFTAIAQLESGYKIKKVNPEIEQIFQPKSLSAHSRILL